MRSFENSKKAYKEAVTLMPGGVNSPVRAFKSVKMDPIFMERGKGSKIYDIDGNEYIDYVLSWGPLILGHANENDLILLRPIAAPILNLIITSELQLNLIHRTFSLVSPDHLNAITCVPTSSLSKACIGVNIMPKRQMKEKKQHKIESPL